MLAYKELVNAELSKLHHKSHDFLRNRSAYFENLCTFFYFRNLIALSLFNHNNLIIY